MLAILALGALLIGAAAPAPMAKAAASGPSDPLPVATTLPLIGTTRAKPVCAAIRNAVGPAVASALKNDQTYGGIRKRIFDYLVKDSDDARELHLMQMDREVDRMVKDVNALEAALKSPALDIAPTTGPDDAKSLKDLRAAMADVLVAQKIQVGAMNVFVETDACAASASSTRPSRTCKRHCGRPSRCRTAVRLRSRR